MPDGQRDHFLEGGGHAIVLVPRPRFGFVALWDVHHESYWEITGFCCLQKCSISLSYLGNLSNLLQAKWTDLRRRSFALFSFEIFLDGFVT